MLYAIISEDVADSLPLRKTAEMCVLALLDVAPAVPADILPWLMGAMQPRSFGPYEPLRRDYPSA